MMERNKNVEAWRWLRSHEEKKRAQLKLLTDMQLSNRTVSCFCPNKQRRSGHGKCQAELVRADNEDSPVNNT